MMELVYRLFSASWGAEGQTRARQRHFRHMARTWLARLDVEHFGWKYIPPREQS